MFFSCRRSCRFVVVVVVVVVDVVVAFWRCCCRALFRGSFGLLLVSFDVSGHPWASLWAPLVSRVGPWKLLGRLGVAMGRPWGLLGAPCVACGCLLYTSDAADEL